MGRMDDPVVIMAALGGVLAGLLLLRLTGGAPKKEAATDPSPSPAVGYANPKRSRASAAPILTALGVTAIGVGLAAGAGEGGLALLALVPGLALLVAAMVKLLRGGRDPHRPQGEPPGFLTPR